MKRYLILLLTLLVLFSCAAHAESIVTNGGYEIDLYTLPYRTEGNNAPVVYFIPDISPESLMAAYNALGIPNRQSLLCRTLTKVYKVPQLSCHHFLLTSALFALPSYSCLMSTCP